MIAYFDTTAVVPLLVEEAGSNAARRLWDQAERVVTIRLLYAEARAALAQAQRTGRLGAPELRAAVGLLEDRAAQADVIEIDERLVRVAGDLAEDHGLRGYDAVHLAAALRAADDHLVVVGGDRTLLKAAQALGLRVAATR